jgi:hypothetical protein
VENAPRLDVSDRTLDWGAQAAYVGIDLAFGCADGIGCDAGQAG